MSVKFSLENRLKKTCASTLAPSAKPSGTGKSPRAVQAIKTWSGGTSLIALAANRR